MELKQVHLFILFSSAYGQLDPGVMKVMEHHMTSLQEHGYLKPELSLTDRSRALLNRLESYANKIK